MNDYYENELKILDVDVVGVCEKLEYAGAKKVYDGLRTISVLDKNGELLAEDKLLRVTEEESVKVSLHINNSRVANKQVIKYKVSRVKEVLDLFKGLGYARVAEARARRISYEWEGVDFDIDIFEVVPAFLEIDIGDGSEKNLAEIMNLLGLKERDAVQMGTEEIFAHYGKDYFEEFKV